MTEATTRPYAGSLVPAKWMPDLRYPHWKKWYNTKTWMGASTDDQGGHLVRGGRHLTDVNQARRLWTRDSPGAARTVGSLIDLTTPYYMLAGTDLTNDTLVGMDYHNPPLQLAQDMGAFIDMNLAGTLAETHSAMVFRVLAVKHIITFQNFNRFPLEIFYAILPTGYNVNVTSSSTVPHEDMEGSGMRKFVIPGVRDVGDKSMKKELEIAFSLPEIFPWAYAKEAGHTNSDATTSVDNSPWVVINKDSGSTDSWYSTVPPGQITANIQDPDLAVYQAIPSLNLRMFSKLQIPLNVGVTTEAEGTGGDVTTNNFYIHWDSSWLCEMVSRHRHTGQAHPGPKAYPSQVV